MQSEQIGNSENFSLHDFIKSEGGTLAQRVQPFSDYLNESLQSGAAHYGRELISAPGPRVVIRDHRTGREREMVMFGSNNYLGLASDSRIKKAVQESIEKWGIGAGGPPLLNGTTSLHKELEQALADMKSAESAMLFGSGFQANLAWVTALLRTGDVLIYDELSHASLYDGLHLAKTRSRVKSHRFRHNDLEDLESKLQACAKDRGLQQLIFVAVEGVYSMDGDLAPLDEIAPLCEKYDAILFVDDAHGSGVMGRTGAGTAEYFGVEHRVPLSMGTFSKSFAVTGGFLAAKSSVIDYLRYFSRSYMFSAHLPQMTAAAVLAGVQILKNEPGRLKILHENRDYVVQGLNGMGFQVASESAIIPVPIPERVDIRQVNRRFHEEGIFLNSIEYPAVGLSEQRLRLGLMATHSKQDLDILLEKFAMIEKEFSLT